MLLLAMHSVRTTPGPSRVAEATNATNALWRLPQFAKQACAPSGTGFGMDSARHRRDGARRRCWRAGRQDSMRKLLQEHEMAHPGAIVIAGVGEVPETLLRGLREAGFEVSVQGEEALLEGGVLRSPPALVLVGDLRILGMRGFT